jgi:hypothetical protein
LMATRFASISLGWLVGLARMCSGRGGSTSTPFGEGAE